MKAKSEQQLTKEFSDILSLNKDAFLRMFAEDVIGVVAKVGNAGHTMYGSGCSISIMIGKGVKGKKYVNAAGRAINAFKESVRHELKKAYPSAEIIPILAQDITVNEFLQHQAGKWFSENGVRTEMFVRED